MSTSGGQIAIHNLSTLYVAHSDIQDGAAGILVQPENGTLVWSRGNIDIEPLFVDADGIDNEPGTEDDDFRLLGCSPCVDTNHWQCSKLTIKRQCSLLDNHFYGLIV